MQASQSSSLPSPWEGRVEGLPLPTVQSLPGLPCSLAGAHGLLLWFAMLPAQPAACRAPTPPLSAPFCPRTTTLRSLAPILLAHSAHLQVWKSSGPPLLQDYDSEEFGTEESGDEGDEGESNASDDD